MARGRAASPALQKPSGWASKRSATTHVSHSAPTACTIGPAQANHRLPVAGTGRALRPKPSTRGVVARLDVVVPHRLLEPLCRGVDCPREPYTVPTSGLDAPPEAVAALYAEFDADHSGSVSYAELCQHLREAYCATPEPRVRFELRKVPEGGLTPARTPESMTPQLGHFCKLDVDWGLGEGGGFEYLELTSETVQEKLRAALKQRWCRVKDLFVSWDSTGDGTVTRHEFAEAMRVLGLHAPAAAIDGIFCSFDPQSSGLVRSSPRPHLRLPSPPPSSPPSTPPSPPRLALAFAFTPLPLTPSPPLPPCVGRLRVNAQEPPAGATQAIPTHAQRIAAHAAAFPAVRCYWPIPATAQAAQVTRRRRRPTQPCALRRYQTRARRR